MYVASGVHSFHVGGNTSRHNSDRVANLGLSNSESINSREEVFANPLEGANLSSRLALWASGGETRAPANQSSRRALWASGGEFHSRPPGRAPRAPLPEVGTARLRNPCPPTSRPRSSACSSSSNVQPPTQKIDQFGSAHVGRFFRFNGIAARRVPPGKRPARAARAPDFPKICESVAGARPPGERRALRARGVGSGAPSADVYPHAPHRTKRRQFHEFSPPR